MNRIGLICSGGGAVMATAYDILAGISRRPDWVVVTDRLCEAEQKARARGIPSKRVNDQNADGFSIEAARWMFGEMNSACSILLFTRLIGPAIFDARPCVNLHPSLLPLFPGLGALAATQASGMTVMGATAHQVDQTTDGGPIVAQVWSPCPKNMETIQRVSFAQKLYLLLLLQEALTDGRAEVALNDLKTTGMRSGATAQPTILDEEIHEAFGVFLTKEGIPWTM